MAVRLADALLCSDEFASTRQVGSLRKIRSQQTIGVLIGTALPRTLRIAEKRRCRSLTQLSLMGMPHDFLGEIRKGIGLVAIPVGRVGYVGVTYLPPPERALGPIYLEAFRASGLDYPRTAVFTTDPAVRISLLANGRFLTIVPSSILSFSKRPDIKILPIELQYVRVPIGIVTLKHRTLSPVAQLFIENAREAAKPLAKRMGESVKDATAGCGPIPPRRGSAGGSADWG